MATGPINRAVQQSSNFRHPTVSRGHSTERRAAKALSKGYFSSGTTPNYRALAGQIARLLPNSAKQYNQNPVILYRHLGKSAISTVAQAAKLTFMGPLAYGIEAASGVDIPTIHDFYLKSQEKIHTNDYKITDLNEQYTQDTNLKLKNLQESGKALDKLAQEDPVFKDKIASSGTTHIYSDSENRIYIEGGNLEAAVDEDDTYVIIKGGGQTGPTLDGGFDNNATIAIKKTDILSINDKDGKIIIEFKGDNTAFNYVNGNTSFYNPKVNVPLYNNDMVFLRNAEVVPAYEVRGAVRFEWQGGVPDYAPQLASYDSSLDGDGVPSSYKPAERLHTQFRHLLDNDTTLTPEQKVALENFNRDYESIETGYKQNAIGHFYSNPEFANQYGPLYNEKVELQRNNIITTTALGTGAGMYAAAEIEATSNQQQKVVQQTTDQLSATPNLEANPANGEVPQHGLCKPKRTVLGKIFDVKEKYAGSLISTVSYLRDVGSIKKATRSDREAIGDHTGKVAIHAIANDINPMGLLLQPSDTDLNIPDTIQTSAQLMAKTFFQNPNLSLGLRSELAKFALQNGLLKEFSSTLPASNSDNSSQMTQQDVVQLLLDGGRYVSAYKHATNQNRPTATAWQRTRAALDAVGNGLLCTFRAMITATILLPAVSIVSYRLLNAVSWKEAYEAVRDGTKYGITHSAEKAKILTRFAKNGLVTS